MPRIYPSGTGPSLAAVVTITTFRREAAVTLAAGDTEATFLPSLGMLGVSLRHGGRELLDLTGGLAKVRAQRTTGLPLLAPWANRLGGWTYSAAGTDVDLTGQPLHVDGTGLPIHGTMLGRPGWEITRIVPGTLEAVFRYDSHPDLLAAFPFPHDLGFEATVEDGALDVATTIRPTGGQPVPVAFGYHPYFRMPGAPRRSWRLMLPARRRLTLDERGLPTGEATPLDSETVTLAARAYDDLYALTDDRRIGLEGGGLRLTVEYEEGYPYAQVFAPARAAFVAIEPMTAETDSLRRGDGPVVRPGEAFTARFSIRTDRSSP
jgi:aldose 1-epimerase